MVTTIEKINDTTVAEIGTQEVRRVYGKTELVERQTRLQEELDKVENLLKELP